MRARVHFLEGHRAADNASPPDDYKLEIHEMFDNPLKLVLGDILVFRPIVEPGESNYGYRQKGMSEDSMDEGDGDSLRGAKVSTRKTLRRPELCWLMMASRRYLSMKSRDDSQ